MPRLKAVTMADADGKARALLEGVQKKLGMAPNVMRTMANSPAVLEAYLGFSSALAKGFLSAKLRERIALAVGEANQCRYCLAAHSALGRAAGLSDSEIADSRAGCSAARKTGAAVAFARKLVSERGRVDDSDLERLHAAGFSEGDITEIVANVAVNLFTNYLNHVADTEIDFPEVGAAEPVTACACG
jgi:uncharacterized peroxidase-related enzyme